MNKYIPNPLFFSEKDLLAVRTNLKTGKEQIYINDEWIDYEEYKQAKSRDKNE